MDVLYLFNTWHVHVTQLSIGVLMYILGLVDT